MLLNNLLTSFPYAHQHDLAFFLSSSLSVLSVVSFAVQFGLSFFLSVVKDSGNAGDYDGNFWLALFMTLKELLFSIVFLRRVVGIVAM